MPSHPPSLSLPPFFSLSIYLSIYPPHSPSLSLSLFPPLSLPPLSPQLPFTNLLCFSSAHFHTQPILKRVAGGNPRLNSRVGRKVKVEDLGLSDRCVCVGVCVRVCVCVSSNTSGYASIFGDVTHTPSHRWRKFPRCWAEVFAVDFAFHAIKTKVNRFPTEVEMERVLHVITEVHVSTHTHASDLIILSLFHFLSLFLLILVSPIHFLCDSFIFTLFFLCFFLCFRNILTRALQILSPSQEHAIKWEEGDGGETYYAFASSLSPSLPLSLSIPLLFPSLSLSLSLSLSFSLSISLTISLYPSLLSLSHTISNLFHSLPFLTLHITYIIS